MGVADDHMCVHPEGREARLGSEKLQSAVTRAALREIIQLTQFKELSEQIMVEDNERFKDEEVAALHRLRAGPGLFGCHCGLKKGTLHSFCQWLLRYEGCLTLRNWTCLTTIYST